MVGWYMWNSEPLNRASSYEIIPPNNCLVVGSIEVLAKGVNPYRRIRNGRLVQWSLVNPDAINPDASLSGRYFWEQTV
jgi:hypothetical protein